MERPNFDPDLQMHECLDSSSNMNSTLKKVLVNIFETLVPFSEILSFEGTIGVTVDKKKMLLLHFSDSISKTSMKNIDYSAKRFHQYHTRNSTTRNYIQAEDSAELHSVSQLCGRKDSEKYLSVQSSVHPSDRGYSSGEGHIPQRLPDYLQRCETSPKLSSVGPRRKGRPNKKISGQVFRNSTSNQLSDDQETVSMQVAEHFYVNIEPDDCGVLDFSAHGKTEPCKKSALDVSAVSSSENDPVSQTRFENDEAECVDNKGSTQTHQDRTLLRQLLQNSNCKAKKSKPVKRRLSSSEDYCPYKAEQVESLTAEESKSQQLLPQDSVSDQDDCTNNRSMKSPRSSVSKQVVANKMLATEESMTERRAISDSILCRLLTSGINLYDTTEVEHLRKQTLNQSFSASIKEASETLQSGENEQQNSLSSKVSAVNFKIEKDVDRVRENFRSCNSNAAKSDTNNCSSFQTNIMSNPMNSKLVQLLKSGLGPMRIVPDSDDINQSLSRSKSVGAESSVARIKKEHEDISDFQQSLHGLVSNDNANSVQTRESLNLGSFSELSTFRD